MPSNQMSATSLLCDDRSSDDSQSDIYATAGPAVLEPADAESTQPIEWTGPRCEKCDAPLASDVVSICRRCGWYASLGAFVEVDPNWETDSESEPTAAETPRPSHIGVWIRMLPRWAWVIVASVLIVIVESVAARLATPAGSGLRTAWSLTQLAIGLVAVAGGHIINFLALAADDADVGLLDLFLKPLKLWLRAVHNLPARLWIANAAASGLVAAIMSLVVIGGLPYYRLWDWGVKEPPKQDLMGAVMNRVKQLDSGAGSDDLEKSISDFAGSQDVEPKDKPKPEPPKPQNNTDCVILGYLLDRDGRLSTLLLGAADGGQLIYAGNVTPKLSDDELRSLGQMLQAIQINKPFIKIDAEATWVKPAYTCRVNFTERTKAGRLRDIEWNKMLGRIQSR